MKIGILHNYFDNIGGAEKLVLMTARKLRADIFTTNIDYKGIKKFGFNDVKIKSIGKVPKNWPNKQLKTLWLFRSLKLKNYDAFFISGEWALAAAKKNKPALWYVHSLPKYIYDLYEQSLSEQRNIIYKNIFKVCSFFFKCFLVKYSSYPEKIATNSSYTQKNLNANLNKNSIILYPPINVNLYCYEQCENFWLSVNRISKHKRLELQLAAFSLLPQEKLFIVGAPEKTKGGEKYYQHLKDISPKNILFLGEITDEKLKKLYAQCRGFITTAKNEDFGITPIEAMASGKPVIAPAEGGYKETLLDEKTGILIENIDVDKLKVAIKKIGRNPASYKNSCLIQAKKFDTEIFIEEIKKIIESI